MEANCAPPFAVTVQRGRSPSLRPVTALAVGRRRRAAAGGGGGAAGGPSPAAGCGDGPTAPSCRRPAPAAFTENGRASPLANDTHAYAQLVQKVQCRPDAYGVYGET